jgi:hypothetical protein
VNTQALQVYFNQINMNPNIKPSTVATRASAAPAPFPLFPPLGAPGVPEDEPPPSPGADGSGKETDAMTVLDPESKNRTSLNPAQLTAEPALELKVKVCSLGAEDGATGTIDRVIPTVDSG